MLYIQTQDVNTTWEVTPHDSEELVTASLQSNSWGVFTGINYISSHLRQWEWIWTGTASWYDYDLDFNESDTVRSKLKSTCALRIYERYESYKVCNVDNGKCTMCYHNDYWPQSTDRIVDLSSKAFAEIWDLRRWLIHVTIEKVTTQ